MNEKQLALILQEGESQKYEFKERLSNLDREMVAFGYSSGGTILLGVDDSGKVTGISISNGLKSQIIDIARNCDPSLLIEMEELHNHQVLAIHVTKGSDRPYRCKEGFYIRNGPSTQKLKRDEIVALINETERVRFDETLNEKFQYPRDYSSEVLKEYLKICGIQTNAPDQDILISLNVVEESPKQLQFNNSGVLFFAKDPQRLLPESFVTAVKYKSHDSFSILDKKDIK